MSRRSLFLLCAAAFGKKPLLEIGLALLGFPKLFARCFLQRKTGLFGFMKPLFKPLDFRGAA